MQANHTMQMTKTERPALGLLSLVEKFGTFMAQAINSTTIRGESCGTNALRTTSINQHAVAQVAKQVRRFKTSDLKRSIRRPRKPLVENG